MPSAPVATSLKAPAGCHSPHKCPYAITEHNRTLVTVVEALTEWGFRHHEAVVGKKRFADPAAASSITALSVL
ncbi:MAG: hypothetical protein ACRYFZ_14560 [Janthinobacterium lividum]